MRRNPQKSTESTPEIEPEQAEVITALIRGATITDATRRANVDRSTFYLWLKSDAAFEAELNRAKREQRDALRAQFRELAEVAMSTVRAMLTGPDVPPAVRLRAAIAVLQSVGTLEPEEIGETDPAAIRERRQFNLDGLLD